MSQTLEQQLERALAALNLRTALPGLAAAVFFIAWNRGIALLYGMFALIVGVLAVAWTAPRWNLRGITARRTLPERANEGETVTVEVALELAGRGSRYLLEVADRLPFAPEGGQASTAFFPRAHGCTTLNYTVACDLRGLHTLGPLELRTGYPLGITTARREQPASEAQILVYPATFEIADLPVLGSSRWPIAGVRAVSRAGGNDQFFAVREYRDGDSPRHIHWPATARRGELVVREHEYIHTTDLMLALDLRFAAQFGHGKHSTVEYMVKIAASIARHALEQGHGVGLYGLGATAVAVPVGYGPQQFGSLLEVLARVQADGSEPYDIAVGEALARAPLGGVLVTFHMLGGEQTLATVPPSFGRHVRVIPVAFDCASFTPRGTRRVRPPSDGYFVRCGDDLARIFAR